MLHTSGRAQTERSSLHRRVRDPYVVVSAVLVVLLVVQTLNRRWSSDFWLHEATLDAFRHNLLHPLQPLVGTHDSFEYYSPYTFVLAVVARVTGWSSVVVLQCAAVANLLLFLVAFRLFVGQLTNRAAVVWSLVATLFFWGLRPWRWSGFLNLNSIGFGLPYPSMFATAVALLVGWALLRYGATKDRRWLVVVGLGYCVVALTHPFTGVWSAFMLLALAANLRLFRRETLVPLVVAGVCVALLLALWPYYRFYGLFSGGQHTESNALYELVPIRIVAALPGLVALRDRFRRDRFDALVLMFAAGIVLYALGGLGSDHNLGRTLPLLLLPLHIGIGELVARFTGVSAGAGAGPRPGRAVGAALVVCGIIGLVGVAPAFASMVPRHPVVDVLGDDDVLVPLTSRYSELHDALPRGSVVVAQLPVMEEVLPAYGYYVLSTGASVFVPDADARAHATKVILAPGTSPARRQALIDRYDVRAVLCATRSCQTLFDGPATNVHPWTLVRVAR
jgi:alpha-1,6-mannosyltransferase